MVEPSPLGTAGAVRYAGESLRESVVVFNGDVADAKSISRRSSLFIASARPRRRSC